MGFGRETGISWGSCSRRPGRPEWRKGACALSLPSFPIATSPFLPTVLSQLLRTWEVRAGRANDLF